MYVNKKPGVKNGLIHGLSVLLDAETFEVSSIKASTGFVVAISDVAGRAMINKVCFQNQDNYNISHPCNIRIRST